jgi:hypothetical protein
MRTELVNAVKKHAVEHYNEGGWDVVVECYEDADIDRAIADATTVDGAIRNVARTVGIFDERRSEAVSLGGGCPECLSFRKHEPGCSKRGTWPLEEDQ